MDANRLQTKVVETLGELQQRIDDAFANIVGFASINRDRLSSSRTYYVRTDGSDSNDGLTDTAAGAYLTLQKAMDTIISALDVAGYTVTIKVGNGTYTSGVVLDSWVGSGQIVFTGDVTTPSNVVISTTSADCFAATGSPLPGKVVIQGFKLQTTTSGSGINAGVACNIEYRQMDFGACATYHVLAQNYALITNAGYPYTISGSAQRHWSANAFGRISVTGAGAVVTLTGTPAFSSAFAVAITGNITSDFSSTFSGVATGKRYSASQGGSINVVGNDETYFPGSALGSIDSTSFYGTLFEGRSRNSAQFDKVNQTFANITGITSTLLSGRTYKFRVVLYTTSDVAGGVKTAMSGTSTATSIIYEATVFQGGALAVIGTSRATALGTTVGNVTAVTVAMIIVEGTITVNTSGTLTAQFARNAASGTSSVLVGSNMIVEDITP